MSEEINDLTVFTVGHSTRTLDEFVGLLKGHGVVRLLDVRSIPRSRRNPQFNRETLPLALAEAGIGYEHLAGLGGFRPASGEAANAGWRNASFRGYADYMQTPEFAEHIEALVALARQSPVAVMCAEAVPWRCHRSLIADALTVRGIEAREIVDARRSQPHKLTPFACVRGTTITYPPAPE
jgi:uncharacterized protein (DUF488 family)